jgi:hypothetical protein
MTLFLKQILCHICLNLQVYINNEFKYKIRQSFLLVFSQYIINFINISAKIPLFLAKKEKTPEMNEIPAFLIDSCTTF